MRRRISLFVGLVMAFGAGLAGGCIDLEDDLDGQPCTVEDDCWHTQECARTIEEIAMGLPGVCKPEGTGCVQGQQLGCACVKDDVNLGCFTHAVATPISNPMAYPLMTCGDTMLGPKCIVMPAEMTP